jgi:flagellar biosynthesis/type III secretory pathway M-ring protein FliF/YscJ
MNNQNRLLMYVGIGILILIVLRYVMNSRKIENYEDETTEEEMMKAAEIDEDEDEVEDEDDVDTEGMENEGDNP